MPQVFGSFGQFVIDRGNYSVRWQTDTLIAADIRDDRRQLNASATAAIDEYSSRAARSILLNLSFRTFSVGGGKERSAEEVETETGVLCVPPENGEKGIGGCVE